MLDKIDDHEAERLWLRAAHEGDLESFAPLYERYVDRIYAYCRYRVGADDAEDVTSQVFVKAMSGAGGYQGGTVAAWLFRIAHNCVVDHLRTRRSHLSLDDSSLPAADDQVLEHLAHDDDLRLINNLIDELSEDHQTLLTLKLVSGLTAERIGQIVGKSAVAVRGEWHRLITRLRARYHHLTKEVDT